MTSVARYCLLALLLSVGDATLEPEPELVTTTVGVDDDLCDGTDDLCYDLEESCRFYDQGDDLCDDLDDVTTLTTTTIPDDLTTTTLEDLTTTTPDDLCDDLCTDLEDSTTSSAAGPVYTISINVVLNSVANLTDESALLNQIHQAVRSTTTDGASVEVVIASVELTSVFGNLPSIIVDPIAQAVADMSGVALSQVTVNGQKHSSQSRRLQETATCITTVPKSSGTDIVAELKRIHATQTAENLTTQLRSGSEAAYQNVAASMPSPPTMKFVTTTVVKGSDTAPSHVDLTSQIEAATGGTADVSGWVLSVSTSASVIDWGAKEDDNAPTAPMLTMWLVAFAIATN
jgi:hypothetical protein